MIDLDAIRKRDAATCGFESMQSIADRRALLAYVDALREAAGRVTCARCMGSGLKYPRIAQGYSTDPCLDCADLRALLNKETPNDRHG